MKELACTTGAILIRVRGAPVLQAKEQIYIESNKSTRGRVFHQNFQTPRSGLKKRRVFLTDFEVTAKIYVNNNKIGIPKDRYA